MLDIIPEKKDHLVRENPNRVIKDELQTPTFEPEEKPEGPNQEESTDGIYGHLATEYLDKFYAWSGSDEQ